MHTISTEQLHLISYLTQFYISLSTFEGHSFDALCSLDLRSILLKVFASLKSYLFIVPMSYLHNRHCVFNTKFNNEQIKNLELHSSLLVSNIWLLYNKYNHERERTSLDESLVSRYLSTNKTRLSDLFSIIWSPEIQLINSWAFDSSNDIPLFV